MSLGSGDFDLLLSYRRAAPSRGEILLVNQTAGVLESRGVRVPRCPVAWFDVTSDGLALGFAWRNPLRIELRRGLGARALIEAAVHECWHLVDLSDPRCQYLGVAELEARAYRVQASWGPVVWQALGL